MAIFPSIVLVYGICIVNTGVNWMHLLTYFDQHLINYKRILTPNASSKVFFTCMVEIWIVWNVIIYTGLSYNTACDDAIWRITWDMNSHHHWVFLWIFWKNKIKICCLYTFDFVPPCSSCWWLQWTGYRDCWQSLALDVPHSNTMTSVPLFRLEIAYVKANLIRGLILGLRPANERRRYKVTPSFIGWTQT